MSSLTHYNSHHLHIGMKELITSEFAGGWPAKGTGDPCRVGGGEVTPLLRLEMEEVGVRRVVGWEGRK